LGGGQGERIAAHQRKGGGNEKKVAEMAKLVEKKKKRGGRRGKKKKKKKNQGKSGADSELTEATGKSEWEEKKRRRRQTYWDRRGGNVEQTQLCIGTPVTTQSLQKQKRKNKGGGQKGGHQMQMGTLVGGAGTRAVTGNIKAWAKTSQT